jgi:hypothetical protein
MSEGINESDAGQVAGQVAAKIRWEGDKLVVMLAGRPVAFRTTLYADDWFAREQCENDDETINLAMYYGELAERLSEEDPSFYLKLGEEDAALLHTIMASLIDAAFARAEDAVSVEGATVVASLSHSLRDQTEEEVELDGKDVKGLQLASVKFRPLIAKDLIRSESAGSSSGDRTVRLFSGITGLPEHQIRRLDLRDFAALEAAFARVKKSPDRGALAMTRTWLVGQLIAGRT